MPKCFFFKKCLFDMGPLINILKLPVLISLNPSEKQFSKYFDDLLEILSKVFLKTNLISITFI